MIEYERVIYTFFDMAGDVGGFGEFLYICVIIMIGGYSSRMYVADVIQAMFRVRLESYERRNTELFTRKKTKLATSHRKRIS